MPAPSITDTMGVSAMMTMQDVQDYLGLSRHTTYQLTHTQGFPAVRFGRTIRVPRDAFLRWLERQAGEEEG